MRLIDANKLMERLKMNCTIVAYGHEYKHKDYGMTLSEINRVMHELSVVEPEEKNGKWIKRKGLNNNSYWECDGCSYQVADDLDLTDYCPKCGNYMVGKAQPWVRDGEEDDTE